MMNNETRDAILPETTTAIPPLPHDACRSDAQCLNGGSCRIVKPGQMKSAIQDEHNYCICRYGFGGQRCESHCPLQCQNGGICHPKSASTGHSVKLNDPSPYVCQCLGHFTGMLCDIPYDNCADGTQCYYGGVCRERDQPITVNFCDCPANRTGDACENVASTTLEMTSVHRAFTSDEIKYISLGIVLGVVSFFVTGLILMRRRRRRNELRYHAVLASEDFHKCELETKEIRSSSPSEKWRNVV
jgi:hypothetical protein